MDEVTLFSDGSSLGNPGPGGYGGILKSGGHEKRFSGGEAHTTNNRMELLGVIKGLEMLKRPCHVQIYSDSSYVVNAINKWLAGWVRKDFKKVKNVDLWKRYLQAAKDHEIEAFWVKGHSGHEENEICDDLARGEAEKIKEKVCLQN